MLTREYESKLVPTVGAFGVLHLDSFYRKLGCRVTAFSETCSLGRDSTPHGHAGAQGRQNPSAPVSPPRLFFSGAASGWTYNQPSWSINPLLGAPFLTPLIRPSAKTITRHSLPASMLLGPDDAPKPCGGPSGGVIVPVIG